jgi:SPP1 gp7 family putative phage head morphogenesis protein
MAADNRGGAIATPIEPGVIARVVEGVRYVLGGKVPTAWFGPQQPMLPTVPDNLRDSVVGRQFDYPVGYNLRTKPRDTESVTYDQLRGLADSYDLLRLIIETRKDQLTGTSWNVSPKDLKQPRDATCDEIERFLQYPDRQHDWSTWLRMWLEDMLVLDAVTIYPRMTKGGDIFALEPMDGSTIKRVIDETGRTPLPPDPAYQQVLKGLPAVDYSADELVYFVRNARTHKLYGYSPVEQIITTVNIALRRQLTQLNYFTEGNVPEALIGVPETWQPDQIRQFQQYWDSMLEGNLAERSHAKFIPGGLKFQSTRSDQHLKDEFDEWLARVCCYAFGVEPTPFIKAQNRATAGTQRTQALSEGLGPMRKTVQSVMNRMIAKYWGRPDIGFMWNDEDSTNPLEQAQINQIYLTTKVKTPDEVRADIGLDPLTDEQQELLNPPPPPQLVMAPPGHPASGVPPGQAPTDGDAAGSPEDEPPNKGEGDTGKAAHGAAQRGADLKKADDPMTTAEKALHGVVTEFLQHLGHKVAHDLASKLGKAGADGGDPDYLDDISLDMAGLIAPMTKVTVPNASDGVDKGFASIKVSADTEDGRIARQKAADWARTRAAELVGKKVMPDGSLIDNPNPVYSISDSTRDMLRADVSEAIDQGLSSADFARQISESYAFSPQRSETIARTEIRFGDTQGRLIGWKQSGVVSAKQWLAHADCCDICQDLDGEIVGLDEAFDEGDPPAHPNCRCTILPVMSSEDDQSDGGNEE